MGRKRIEIDWDEVDKMLRAGCTGTEAAAFLGIHEDTLYLKCEQEHKMGFSAYSAQKKAVGHKMLKMARFETALEGNTTMQIWLSKQWFGERDKTDATVNARVESIDLTQLTDEQLDAIIRAGNGGTGEKG